MSQQPLNIVFIMADQLAAGFLHCYGGEVDSTPTLDRLAAEGARFERCYATHPVCAPNRATILTGRSSCVHGIISNNFVLATDDPTYAHVLRAAGYRTGGFGKFHQTPMHTPAPDHLAHLGFDVSHVTEDPKWPWLDWVAEHHPDYYEPALAMCWPWPNTPSDPRFAEREEALRQYLTPLQEAEPWPLMHPSPLPPEVHDTTYITEMGLTFMQDCVDHHAGQPFFCHVSYVDPHDPYDPPEPYASMFDPADMRDPLPAAWMEEDFETLAAAHHEFPGFSDIYDQPAVIRRLRALYHGSLRFLDDQIARIVSFLEAQGLWDSAVLVFTTDHGDMLGDHGLITKGVKPYDTGIRVPLIVAGAGVAPQVVDRLTCTLDFYPTFCDWAALPPEARPPVEGCSFAPVCAGGDDPEPWPEVLVSYGGVQTVISDDGWRLTRFPDEARGQMFNLVADPGEQHNLYDDPAFADRRRRLLEQLVRALGRPGRTPHYRTMPVVDGMKYVPVKSRLEDGVRLYPNPTSPYLDRETS
jgi:choline-sulfatase